MPASGGESLLVIESGSDPQFNASGDRIFFLGGSYLDKAYKSVDLNGNEERTHFNSKCGNNFIVSPDNRWVVFNELFKLYVAPMPQTGKAILIKCRYQCHTGYSCCKRCRDKLALVS